MLPPQTLLQSYSGAFVVVIFVVVVVVVVVLVVVGCVVAVEEPPEFVEEVVVDEAEEVVVGACVGHAISKGGDPPQNRQYFIPQALKNEDMSFLGDLPAANAAVLTSDIPLSSTAF